MEVVSSVNATAPTEKEAAWAYHAASFYVGAVA